MNPNNDTFMVVVARQAVKIVQLEEVIEILKAELIKLQPKEQPNKSEGEELPVDGDFEVKED